MEEKEKCSIFNAKKKIKVSMVVDFPADFPLYLSKFMFISYYLNMCSPKKIKKINKRVVPNKVCMLEKIQGKNKRACMFFRYLVPKRTLLLLNHINYYQV